MDDDGVLKDARDDEGKERYDESAAYSNDRNWRTQSGNEWVRSIQPYECRDSTRYDFSAKDTSTNSHISWYSSTLIFHALIYLHWPGAERLLARQWT